MQTMEPMPTSEPEVDAGDAGTDRVGEAEPSALESAIGGLAGLLLGSTIVYFAFPYCVSC